MAQDRELLTPLAVWAIPARRLSRRGQFVYDRNMVAEPVPLGIPSLTARCLTARSEDPWASIRWRLE